MSKSRTPLSVFVTALVICLLTTAVCFVQHQTVEATDCNSVILFQPARRVNVGAISVGATVADFNEDGNPDFAVPSSSGLAIFLGAGNGNFSGPTFYPAASFIVPVAAGDFNNDGNVDLAAGSSNSDVWIYKGDGAGGFSAPTTFPNNNPGYTYGIAVGDFNNDNREDLAIGNQFGRVSILLGNGQGGFGAPTLLNTGADPLSLVSFDFNSDGKADLAVCNQSSNNISVLLGNGSGGFSSSNNYATGNGPTGFAVGDFTSDSKLDLVVANTADHTFTILAGDGTGRFAPQVISAGGADPQNVRAGDFNLDGKLDLATVNTWTDTASVLLGDGAGNFGSASSFAVSDNPVFVTISDVNLDSKPDILVPSFYGADVSVLINDGTNDVSPPTITASDVITYATTPTGTNVTYNSVTHDNSGMVPTLDCSIPSNSMFPIGTTSVTCAAIDSCGNQSANVSFNVTVTCGPVDLSPLGDIEVNATSADGAVINYAGVDGVASINFSVPNGSSFPIGTTNVSYVVTELCGNTIPGSFQVRVIDSAPELTIPSSFSAFATSESGKVVSYTATAADAVSGVLPVTCTPPSGTLFPMGQTTVNCQVTDGAGNTTTGSFNVTIVNCIGCITPTFEFRNHDAIAPVLTRITSADFNRDGKFDIAVTSHDYSIVSVLLSDGNGGFSTPNTLPAGGFSVPVETGDFNRDGKPDLAVGSWDGNVWIYIGDGNGGFADAAQFPDTNSGGEAYQINVNDFNRDGNPDLAIAHQFSGLSILLGNGTGQFAAPVDYIVGSGPVEVVGADLNNDGKIDLVTSNAQGGDTSILLGDGLGGFAVSSLGSTTGSITLGDFNSDTNIDLVHKNPDDNGISLRLGDGAGSFGSPISFATGGSGINRPRAADFNGDGKLDLAIPQGWADNVVVLVGDGSGNFSPPLSFAVGSGPADIAVANLNNDGKPDIACANFFSGNLSVLLNSSYQTPLGPGSVVVVNNTTLMFDLVTAGGTTSIIPIDPATVGEVPGGFSVSNSVAYEIATTATFTGSVTLAFKVPGPISEEEFNNLAILHNENGTLVDVTATTPTRDYATLTIYATTTSFSPFYLARRGSHIRSLFDQTKAYKRGSTIPIKLQVLDASNANLSSSSTSLVTRDLRLMSGNTLAPIEDSGNANPDYAFRYDSALGGAGGGYIFNLSTRGLAPGQYVLSFYVGTERSFFYTLKFEVK